MAQHVMCCVNRRAHSRLGVRPRAPAQACQPRTRRLQLSMATLRLSRALLASALLHLAPLGLALSLGNRLAAPPPPLSVQVDLLEELTTPTKSGTPFSRSRPLAPARPGGLAGAPAPLPLSALAPSRDAFLPLPEPGARAPRADAEDLSPFAASPPWQSSAPEASGALWWVHRKTELALGYPPELVRHGISGRVQATLAFGTDGRWRAERMRVRADSPYLRVYVHRLLERVFSAEPVPANLRRWPGELRVQCLLTFELRESGATVTVNLPSTVVGNRLFFTRSQVKSRLEEKLKWELGPLHGMLPVPAVGLDVLWFARQAKELRRPTVPVDDLAPYRNDPLFLQ